MAYATADVTFTVLEDGIWLPSISAVLPAGEYAGRVVRSESGVLMRVTITIPRVVLDELKLDAGGTSPLAWDITQDYRGEMIREDRV